MRALLLYPRFPKSFWSFEKTMELIGKRAVLPPLGLITVAALLPDDWELLLVDRNVEGPSEEDWDWAEIVLLSGMIAQRADFLALIREARGRGKPVAVGGPYATSLPDEMREAGADFLVLDEGEITIPPFVEALARGETGGTFRSGGKMPDVTQTPIPRYELLDLDAYSEMSVQFSRGCPFLCEFCDIIVLYGRRPRTKRPAQMIAEIERLYELGWTRSIFVVDDNFIGNKKAVKEFLRELLPWVEARGFPFTFDTEASVDLARDQELMDLMTACGFGGVFLGIETPDEASLALTRKHQNTRSPLGEAVDRITASGLRIMAGFIIGFDGEEPGAGRRIVDFCEAHAIPTVTFSMLQALPTTALTDRLREEGRLLEAGGDLNQTTLMNFLPTRPLEEIAREYVDAFWELYDPRRYLERAYRTYLVIGKAPCHAERRRLRAARRRAGGMPDRAASPTGATSKAPELRALCTVLWRQGVVRSSRFAFWRRLAGMLRRNPRGVMSYLGVCAHYEHFSEYRREVRREIEEQLAAYLSAADTGRGVLIPHPPPSKLAAPATSATSATPTTPARGEERTAGAVR